MTNPTREEVMEAKYTPGPWTAIRDGRRIAAWRVESDDAWVADIYQAVSGDFPEIAANARLIAAAPALYEALKEVERLINEALPKFDWSKSALDANAISLLNDVPIKVRAALSSVEGT